MDEEQCPKCRTTKYRNPSLKLLVNVCGHALCENCVELLFPRGSGTCPECFISLKKSNFRLRLFENPFIEKEVDIRKKILKDYNRKEDSFSTVEEYNDYLEEIEDIVFNLSNNIDVEATKRKVEEYKKINKEIIQANRGKKSQDELELELAIEEEIKEAEERKERITLEKTEEQNQKNKFKEDLLDELTYSDLPANQVIASHTALKAIQEKPVTATKKTQSATMFSTGIKLGFGGHGSSLTLPQVEAVPYKYELTVEETFGPRVPNYIDLEHLGYTKHIRPTSPHSLGGGYTATLTCFRVLQEGFCGLFCTPDIAPSPILSISTSSSDSVVDMDTT